MRVSGYSKTRAAMKGIVFCLGALFLCAYFARGQSGEGANPKRPTKAMNEASSSRLLERARSDWPAFLRAFRAALRSHDLKALHSMTSQQFKANCVTANGKEFFTANSGFDHYLEILTPGARGNFTSEIGAVEYVKERGTAQISADMTCGWSLTFEFRMNVAWRLIHYGQSCEGC